MDADANAEYSDGELLPAAPTIAPTIAPLATTTQPLVTTKLASSVTHITKKTLMQLAKDPLRKSKSFNVGYKPKIKPKINALKDIKNYTRWSLHMTSLLMSLMLSAVVIDGAIPSVEGTVAITDLTFTYLHHNTSYLCSAQILFRL